MYQATIECSQDKSLLYQALKPEEQKDKRSQIKVRQEKDSAKIIIKAEDSVALRAITNSIARLLTIHKKIKDIKNG